MARLIRVDGSSTIIKPEGENDTLTLEQMQELIGGYIQIVQTKEKNQLLVLDEEGKIKGKLVNKSATKLYIHGEQDPIVGDVIIATPTEIGEEEKENAECPECHTDLPWALVQANLELATDLSYVRAGVTCPKCKVELTVYFNLVSVEVN